MEPATSGTQALRPRARILRTLGDELISSESVALIELVKNAYDADATRVLIRFHDPLEAGQGKIEVIDNGHGMDLETIQSSWLEPATLSKKREVRSESGARRVLGEKGIGRFATSRIGNYLEVVTRRETSESEIRVFFDWTQFDDETKYLDQVDVLWEEEKPIEICPSGVIQSLWNDKEKPDSKALTHGTVLKMEQLRADWSADDLLKIRTDLSRLVSPFAVQREEKKVNSEFQIKLVLPDRFAYLSGEVEPPESLTRPHYLIKGDVYEDGRYNLSVKLRGQEKAKSLSDKFVLHNVDRPRCGPFHIELRVWDRDLTSMHTLAAEYESTIIDIRRDLDAAAGINIYRDGFRVLPYGEPKNDWLRLDLRRVQNPTLRLSNNQIVGFVSISADKNPNLRDQSNREGIIESPAFDDLRNLVTMVLAELETRRYDVRPRREKSASKKGGLFSNFDLENIRALVKTRHPTDKELLQAIGEKEDDLERRVEEVQEVLSRYRRLATLGELIDTILHDGRAPLAKIGNEAELGSRDIIRSSQSKEPLLEKLAARFNTIDVQSDVLATVFRKIEPFGGRKRGRPARVRLEQVIADAFAVLESEIAEVGANVNLPNGDTQVTVDQAEIQQVIINLLRNSLHWLRKVPKEIRAITVQMYRKVPNEVEIIVADTGPGIEPEFRDRIFEPYFSTKPDGVGLGLAIAGEIISEYYDGSLELLDSKPSSGATFRITLRKRV